MNNQPLVSIIMPAFNAEKTILQSIQSVMTQTYLNWELIIVDDCSTDRTVHIMNEAYFHDSRIKLLFNDVNLGVSQTRNKGIDYSTGQWIAFLDSDDIWINSKLFEQMHLALLNNLDFVFTGSAYIDSEGNRLPGVFSVPNEISYRKLLFHNVISCSSVLLNKNILENMRMGSDKIHEDYAFWLKLLSKGTIAYSIDKPLLVYRISKNSKSGNKWKSMRMTFNVYRSLKINILLAMLYTATHTLNSVIKYKKIYF